MDGLELRKLAALGLRSEIARLNALLLQLESPALRNETQRAGARGVSKPRRKKRRMSAEARKRISDAQKARWAKQRKS